MTERRALIVGFGFIQVSNFESKNDRKSINHTYETNNQKSYKNTRYFSYPQK